LLDDVNKELDSLKRDVNITEKRVIGKMVVKENIFSKRRRLLNAAAAFFCGQNAHK